MLFDVAERTFLFARTSDRRVLFAVDVMNTAIILLYGARGSTMETMIPAIRNAVYITWEAVQPTLCDVDPDMVQHGAMVDVSGRAAQTRSRTSASVFMCEENNVKCSVHLSRPHLLHGFHQQARSCSHVSQIAPHADFHTSFHVRVDHERIQVQRKASSATEREERCGATSLRPWPTSSSPHPATRVPDVALDDETALAVPVLVLETERL